MAGAPAIAANVLRGTPSTPPDSSTGHQPVASQGGVDVVKPPAAVAVTPASSDAVPTPPEKLAPATGAYYRLFIHRVLPQIPNLNGETVQDWVEHFEAVATLAGWNDHFAFSVSAQGNCQSILSVVYTGAKEQLPPPRDGIEETIHPRPVDRRGDPAFSQSSTGYKGVCR